MESVKRLGRTLLDRWRGYWFEEIPPYPISAFRILFGLYLLCYLGQYATRVEIMFSSAGVYMPYRVPDIAFPPAMAWIAFASMLFLVVLFTVGWRTRIVTPLLLVYYLYHYVLNFAVTAYSYDRLNILFLIILCFADLDGAWSLSGHWTGKSTRRVTAWATRLIAFDVAFMYFGSGIWKVMNPFWHTGKIIELNYIGTWGTPASMWFVQLGWPDGFYTFLTVAVITFEVVFGFLLYVRKMHRWTFLFGTLFHISNWIFFSIAEFMSFPLAYVLFMEGSDVKKCANAMCGKLRGWFTFGGI